MNLLIIDSKEMYHWDILKGDPVTYPIPSLGEWFFVNPLVYFGFDENFRTNNLKEPHVLTITSERVIVFTSYFIFVNQGKKFGESVEEDYLVEDILNSISHFFVNLRYVSKQFNLPTGFSNLSIMHQEISSLPDLHFPTQSPNPDIMVRKVFVDIAITRQHLEKATIYPSDFKTPLFDTILLDALGAFANGDYRRAILYSAMSVEIIAATKLDEHYTSAIQSGHETGNMRIVSIQQANGKTVIKDPIYEYLSSRTDFAQLLHERALYVLNKSLLIDDENLYQTAKKLYRTRNKIVHQGEPPYEESSSYFSISETDTQLALECAIEIFKWFGELGQYTIPYTDFPSEFYKLGNLSGG